MPRYEIHIYGTVPDCLELDAENEDEAIEFATQDVLDRLDFRVVAVEDPVLGWGAIKPWSRQDAPEDSRDGSLPSGRPNCSAVP